MQKRIFISGSLLRSRNIAFKKEVRNEIIDHVFPLLQLGLFKTNIFRTFKLEDAQIAHAILDSGDFTGKLVFVF
ncbi:zinc-binding dehydrogenase [Sphingobacterium sp. KU25419]|nr:zinc-binding dehydrogenase [Sphingobacterium sp. KU25419]